MESIAYDNPIRRQVFDLENLLEPQLAACFGPELRDLMSMAEIFDVRRIIVTGCGDSYAASIAEQPVMERYCDCFGVQAMRAIEFTRFLTREQIGIGEPNSPLVIAISAGGGTARVCEALEKANEVGAFSVAMTNVETSRAASIAKRTYCLHTPDFPDKGPGLRSYFASLLGLLAIANRLGHVRGALPPTAPADFQDAIRWHIKKFWQELERIDAEMLELAADWKDFSRFDVIGDGAHYGSAFFCAAKFLEASGCAASAMDSEEWCHINYFLKEPEMIGTIVLADCHAPSYGRCLETAASAHAIGRPVLAVTNGNASDFKEGIKVCRIPDAPEGYEWLMTLSDYIPASLLAGYVAVLQGEPFFRRYVLADGTPDPENPFGDFRYMTLQSSKIEVHT